VVEDRHPEPVARRRYATRLPPGQRREQLLDAALEVICTEGYGGISIEAIARMAEVTRPVVYDHFSNLPDLLSQLIQREERAALRQLESLAPPDDPRMDPAQHLPDAVTGFLSAVTSRPTTWRLILLPPEGTPRIVREHVEAIRTRAIERIEDAVARALRMRELDEALDPELIARAIHDVAVEAGRQVLTDSARFPPHRYVRFTRNVLTLLLPSPDPSRAEPPG
jgi:AcrR family transcriptional regulator